MQEPNPKDFPSICVANVRSNSTAALRLLGKLVADVQKRCGGWHLSMTHGALEEIDERLSDLLEDAFPDSIHCDAVIAIKVATTNRKRDIEVHLSNTDGYLRAELRLDFGTDFPFPSVANEQFDFLEWVCGDPVKLDLVPVNSSHPSVPSSIAIVGARVYFPVCIDGAAILRNAISHLLSIEDRIESYATGDHEDYWTQAIQMDDDADDDWNLEPSF